MQFRKVIHISGVLIPIAASQIGKIKTMESVLLGFVVYFFLEISKPKMNRDILSMVYRENELTGFSIEPLSYFISVLSLLAFSFFIDERICYAAITVLAVGDGFAGVIGKRYGRHKFSFNRNKSWEGSISGFIAASLAGFYFAGILSIAGSFFGMLAGAVNKQDNIAVPFAALVAMGLVRFLGG